MHESDQRARTCSVVEGLMINPYELWMHYISVGGCFDLARVLSYLGDDGVLPARERDRVSCAVNDLTLEPRRQPRAPYSDAPLD